MNKSDTRECFTDHLGLWAMDPVKLNAGLAAVRSGILQPRAMDDDDEPAEPPPPYHLEKGVAVISISGAMRKKASKFGGCSTIDLRSKLRLAIEDEEVAAVMLRIDSPGGQVAGLMELADDVRAAASKKPLAAYIEDLGASAAYWTATAAPQIYCNRAAEVGSLGVLSVLVDESGALEREGIKVHVVSTGPYKGLGADGKVSDKLLEQVREQVEALGAMFRETIAQGRKLTPEQVDAIFTGKIWMAADAEKLGLVDGIMPFEKAMSALRVSAVMPSRMPALQEKNRIVLDATTACASLATSTQAIGESTMLTKEELKAALDKQLADLSAVVDTKILAAFKERDEKAAKAALENVAVEVDAKGVVNYTADDFNKAVADAAAKGQEKAQAEFERKARIKDHAAEIVKKGSPVPEAEVVKQLSACKTDELEQACYEKLMAHAELASVRAKTAGADETPKAKNTEEYWASDFDARVAKGDIEVSADPNPAKRAANIAKQKANYIKASMELPALTK